MTQETMDVQAGGILISERAAKRIAKLIADDGSDSLMFRVTVSGGGCSGFQYGFSLDGSRGSDDLIFPRDDISVIVDNVSLDLLRGCELDYTEDLIGSYFSIKNPNATSTCGCGSSFSV